MCSGSGAVVTTGVLLGGHQFGGSYSPLKYISETAVDQVKNGSSELDLNEVDELNVDPDITSGLRRYEGRDQPCTSSTKPENIRTLMGESLVEWESSGQTVVIMRLPSD